MELSWKLRPASSALEDKFVDCDWGSEDIGASGGSITGIRLSWTVRDDHGVVLNTDGADWHCKDNQGVTRFQLPAGTAELSVAPECDGIGAQAVPAAPNTYIAPAPVQRQVTLGDTVSLGAVELVVQVSDCDPANQPCACQR